ncbi:BTAD domain-containing putative transcriptional regulator [Promicromonospora sp. NPDC057488]|uniref:AfsR/SARP family transcriptional regulator n=1 Tax=Promicromonospora sp. NPDC057488 TaxID=3346147 RepID=UPI0036708BCB
MSDLHLALLGPVRMWRDGTEIPLGSPQQRAVLAVLLLHEGRVVPGEELVDALWGEAPPKGAWGTLRTYVSRLRQVFSGSAVVIKTAGTGYAVHTPPGSVDAVVFRDLVTRGRDQAAAGSPGAAATSLTQALALWTGDGLDGAPGEYLARQRARLQAARLAATELRFAAMLDAGTDAVGQEDVAAELTLLVEQHPFLERLRELLMRALYRQGRQADALAVYHAGEALLRDELGIDPGPALRAAHQRILVSDPGLLTTPEHVPPALDAGRPDRPRSGSRTGRDGSGQDGPGQDGPAPTLLPARLPQFTGRDAELARIAAALEEPADGTVTTVGVHGLDGLGRSALVVEAAHRAVGRYPGGCLYGDLGRTAGGLTEVLGAWLGAYGVPPADVPGSATARAVTLRDATKDRRVLAVLDGVEDTTTLGTLTAVLPPGSAVLFVARRWHPEPVSTTWVQAGPLPADDGLRLLTHVAGRDRLAGDPDAAARLVALSCGWPLSLRLIGGRLNTHPRWSVAAMADQLAHELANPAATVHDDCLLAEAPVLRAYLRLRPAQARALRRTAGLESGTFAIHEAADALGMTCEDVWSVLDSLVELGLLTENGPAGLPHSTTYQMAAVVRAFARRRPEEPDELDAWPVRRDRAELYAAS